MFGGEAFGSQAFGSAIDGEPTGVKNPGTSIDDLCMDPPVAGQPLDDTCDC